MPLSPEHDPTLRALLAYLAQDEPPADGEWQGWRIARLHGGANGLPYRATGQGFDLVCKFTVADQRRRAAREYAVLTALAQAGLRVAPEPVLLDETSYRLPVMVQTWIEGEVSPAVPATDAEWELLLQNIVAVHRLTPERCAVPLPPMVSHVAGMADCEAKLQQHLARIPTEDRPAYLEALTRRMLALFPQEWPPAPVALCHDDANITNYIRRPDGWVAVDWESSGWGDPAFDVADLMAHAAYIDVPAERRAWVTERYCALVGDAACARRIELYYGVWLIFWVVRTARFLYEIPRGLDQRLTGAPVDWQASMQAKYEHYRALAEAWTMA